MPLGSSSDVAHVLRDAGEVVVYNGVTSYGIVDHMDAMQGTDSGGMVQVRFTSLLVQTDALPDLRTNGRIVIAGSPYRIDGPPMLEDDGMLTRMAVARTT